MRTEDAGEPWLMGPLAYVIFASLVGVARGQSTIYTFHGDQSQDLMGASVDEVGDMDLDGYDDFVIGIHGAGSVGKSRVYSGRLGLMLHEFLYGGSVSGAGDVDGDGWPDVMVSSPQYDSPFTNAGSVWVYSGKTGVQIYQFKGNKASAYFGAAIDSAGDVDNDGYADVIVGAYNDSDLASGQGSVRVFSGQTGTQIHLFWGDPVASQGAGWTVAGVGDVNADGFDDVAYGSRQGKYVRVRSGKDGTLLKEWPVAFGWAIAAAGDVDMDGVPDLIVGDISLKLGGVFVGGALVHSIRTGAVIHTLYGTRSRCLFRMVGRESRRSRR